MNCKMRKERDILGEVEVPKNAYWGIATQSARCDKASEIARRATKTGKTIKQPILEMGLKVEGNLDELLDPRKML